MDGCSKAAKVAVKGAEEMKAVRPALATINYRSGRGDGKGCNVGRGCDGCGGGEGGYGNNAWVTWTHRPRLRRSAGSIILLSSSFSLSL